MSEQGGGGEEGGVCGTILRRMYRSSAAFTASLLASSCTFTATTCAGNIGREGCVLWGGRAPCLRACATLFSNTALAQFPVILEITTPTVHHTRMAPLHTPARLSLTRRTQQQQQRRRRQRAAAAAGTAASKHGLPPKPCFCPAAALSPLAFKKHAQACVSHVSF